LKRLEFNQNQSNVRWKWIKSGGNRWNVYRW